MIGITTYILLNIQLVVCEVEYDEIHTYMNYVNSCTLGNRPKGRYKWGPYLSSGIEDDPGLILIDPYTEDKIKYLEN